MTKIWQQNKGDRKKKKITRKYKSERERTRGPIGVLNQPCFRNSYVEQNTFPRPLYGEKIQLAECQCD